jgi:hypothetical protein
MKILGSSKRSWTRRKRFVVHADEKLTAFVIRHPISDQKITAPHTPQV